MANRSKEHKSLGRFGTYILQKYHYHISKLSERVGGDGGVMDGVKSMECGSDIIDNLDSIDVLDDASLIITPNAVKEGLLYAAKPTTYGPELVTNGDFDTDTDWVKGTGWTIGSGVASCDGTQVANTLLTQAGILTSGRYYTVTFTLSNYSAGAVNARLGSSSNGTSYSVDGTYTERFISDGTGLSMRGNSTFIGSIDNVSVIEDLTGDMTWTGGGGTRVNKDLLIESVALNVPRLNYPLDGGCPHVLVEPQRTNLSTYSEEFDNAAWTKTRLTITANATTAPDGTMTADKLVEDATVTSIHLVRTAAIAGLTATTVYTVSVFAKAAERPGITLELRDSTSIDGGYVTANLVTGTIGTPTALGTGSSLDATIEDYGSGWYRVSLSVVMNNARTSALLRIHLNNGTTDTYSGDATSGVYIWGAQFEEGAYPTMPIPIVASTVTRVKDRYELANVYTNNMITASGGTWMIELENNIVRTRDASGQALTLGDNATGATNSIVFKDTNSTDRIGLKKFIAGSPTTLYTTTTDHCKIVLVWDGATVDVYENGIKVVSGSAFTITAMEFLVGNGFSFPYYIKQQQLFPTPLTDEQCIELSSLYGSYTEMSEDLDYNLILDA